MPTYEYICTSCAHEFEAFQSMKDDPLTDCPACAEGRVRRKIGLGAGIIFKGSGFYETDFKDRKGEKPKESGDGGKAKENGAKTDATAKTEGGSKSEKQPSSGGSGKGESTGSSTSTSRSE